MVPFKYFHQRLASEVGRIAKYSDGLVQFEPLAMDEGDVLSKVNASPKKMARNVPQLKKWVGGKGRSVVLLNGNLNHSYDIQALLGRIHPHLNRRDRVLALVYSPYWAWLHRWMHKLGWRKGEAPTTFLTRVDARDLARLSHFEVVRERPLAVVPFSLLGLGAILNTFLESIPVVRELAFAMLLVLRPIGKTKSQPSFSIVIPARDEKDNIEPAIRRIPDVGTSVEVVFIEGHSKDGTWEEIQRVKRRKWKGIRIQAYQQTGKGKADAVRLGFDKCKGDVVTILDADLSMPPELMGRFYNAYAEGLADFINGSRLVYPMEGKAMRFLNWLGNIFFAKSLSFCLETNLGDSLCGTKLFSRADYQWMKRWNQDFGKFDPFGDYEMLFPAAELGLGIIDVPIRYMARTYGTTKINRFRDGLILLRMTAVALWRVRMGVSR